MARSEICKGCCPSGGALFDVVQPQADFEAEIPIDPQRFVKRCRNCGTEKPWHMRTRPTEDSKRNCKIGTVPQRAWVHGRDRIAVGAMVRLRLHERERWRTFKIDRVNEDGYFFAS